MCVCAFVSVCVCSTLMSWVREREEEVLKAEPVAGVPERVRVQMTEVEVS